MYPNYEKQIQKKGVTMRIGLRTGGGDCPGLNAVIRVVVRHATTITFYIQPKTLESAWDVDSFSLMKMQSENY